jgi:hypothetical protein
MLSAPTLTPVEQLPVGQEQFVAPELMRLQMSNATTIPVVLSVNGGVGREFAAGGSADLGLQELGPLPWKTTVRTTTGRIVLQLTVLEGSVARTRESDGSVSMTGVAKRVSLSCGGIDVWSGPPISGPAPDQGPVLDCEP